ncbi:MAG: hypothetical protein U0744_13855 [Gemmataceae bacterium]
MTASNQNPQSPSNSLQCLGLLLIAMAVASFVLPMIGVQFRLVTLLQRWSPNAPFILGGIGLAMAAIGSLAERSSPSANESR